MNIEKQEKFSGEKEFLDSVTTEWVESLVPERKNSRSMTATNEIVALIIVHSGYNAMVPRVPANFLESKVRDFVDSFAQKFSWRLEEKQLAYALMSLKLLDGRISSLRKIIKKSS